jgi:hypothetical protein
MRSISTNHVKSFTEIERTLNYWELQHKEKKQTVNGFMAPKNSYSHPKDEWEEITTQMLLFELISSGLDENLDKIIRIVKKDPKRNLFPESEKHQFFINQKNYEGFTPLYIACLNGHVKFAEVLIKYGADHLMKYGVTIILKRIFRLKERKSWY